jgi:thiamine-monophosphate kinase
VIDLDLKVGELGERALVRYLRSRVPQGPGVSVGPGDDAAAVETGPLTLVTTDSLVEGQHFERDWSPGRLLGRKALTVNLSDIAAMGGVPRYATVSLHLPPDLRLSFVAGLYDGLLERAAETGVSLVGGNVARSSGPVVIDVALLGAGDRLITRKGAAPGDLLVVTGSLGAAAAGLDLVRQGARLNADGEVEATGVWTDSSRPAVLDCLRAFLDPCPPLSFARAISEQEDLVHAAMDVSDGLSSDLPELCQESGLLCVVDPEAVPVDPKAAALERARGGDSLGLALHGGEDYQLLMAVPPDRLAAVHDLAVVWDVPLHTIGEFSSGAPAVSLRQDERLSPLAPAGHDAFGGPRLLSPTRPTLG